MKWKIACIQMDIAFGQPDINFQVAEQWLGKAAMSKPDIVILPELWSTGYDLTRLNEIADEEAEKTIECLKDQAKKHQFHIIGGSVAKKASKGIYNNMIIINKHGNLIKQYDKLHLFQLMDEHHFLQPGEKDG
ncbi:putative amidohydrolase [Peribacillus sp. B2I2]|uniref:nitrilase-related carbon-nitrogen hydrolase n=1 Tax=Peribacillus sp. B2I2 TaxID=3156468 RepID=UPI00351119C2